MLLLCSIDSNGGSSWSGASKGAGAVERRSHDRTISAIAYIAFAALAKFGVVLVWRELEGCFLISYYVRSERTVVHLCY